MILSVPLFLLVLGLAAGLVWFGVFLIWGKLSIRARAGAGAGPVVSDQAFRGPEIRAHYDTPESIAERRVEIDEVFASSFDPIPVLKAIARWCDDADKLGESNALAAIRDIAGRALQKAAAPSTDKEPPQQV